MTGTARIIPSMDMTPRMTSDQQRLAAMDGAQGKGGCEHCDARYEFVHLGHGLAQLRIGHRLDCPAVAAARRAREQQ